MREARVDLVRPGVMQRLRYFADRAPGIAHVLDYEAVLTGDVSDDMYHIGLVRTGVMQRLGYFADRAPGIAHVVDYQAVLTGDVSDDIHHIGLVRTLATLVAKCETRIETLCVCPRTLRSAGVRRYDDQVLDRV